MGYDPFSPIAPALINVLCIPANRSTPEVFNKYLFWLQDVASIIQIPRRGSVSGSGANSHKHSTLLLNFSSSIHSEDQRRGSFFEPNRRPCLVIGLFDNSGGSSSISDADSLTSAIKNAKVGLEDGIGAAGLTGIPSRILVFDSLTQVDVQDVVFASSVAEHADVALSVWLRQAVIDSITQALTDLRTQDVELPESAQSPKRLSSIESRSEENKRQSIMPTLTRTSTPTTPLPEDGAQVVNSGRTVSAALLKVQLGAWNEALDQFAEGARAARDANSPAWHAKALEGILVCLLLLAWSSESFQIPQNCYPTSRGLSSSSAVHSIAEANRSISEKFTGSSTHPLQALTAMLPGLLATVMNLYDRSTMGFDNALPIIYACEAKVRMGKMLIKLQKHACKLNDDALQELIGHRSFVPENQSLEPATVPLVLRSSALSSLLIEAITDAQNQSSIQTLSPVCLTICNSLSALKLNRKQGFYLKDFLQKLPPVLMEARKAGIPEVNNNISTGSKNLPSTANRQHQQSARSIRALLRQVMRTYDIPDFSSDDLYASHSEEHIRRRLSAWLSMFKNGDVATKLETLRCCIRVSDALPDLAGSLQFMSLLLFVVRQSVTMKKGLGNPVPLIPTEEQARLTAGINNAIQVASSLSQTHLLAEYWDDFMIRDIRLHVHPDTGKLVAHSSQDLSHTTTSGSAKKDPFIYNPFSEGRASSGPAILVKNEVATFEVLLQNPLEIDIEVESISLYTEGCSFEASEHSVFISPLSMQTFTLRGIPKEDGSLKIIGCRAKIKNCAQRDFLTFGGIWKPLQTAKRHAAKFVESELPSRSILELKVIDPLPNLIIESTSLVQDSVMLLDGEKTTLTMTLQNVDEISADLVLFSFQDSVSRQLHDALDTKDLMPTDMHELQYQLASRPAIRRISKNDPSKAPHNTSAVRIPSYSSQSFDFEVLGKPGLTEAIILVDYTYLGKPRNEVDGTFYTRQLRLSLKITVNASVDIPRCNILSLPPDVTRHSISVNGNQKLVSSSRISERSSRAEVCLLQLDLRSIWQSPITFTIETSSPLDKTHAEANHSTQTWSVATTSTLQPTQIERALIPISRIYVADPFEPIPTLDTNTSKRQFVVSASKLSLEAETAAREAFWYREELCRLLRITWKEEYGSRYGEIDLRKGIRLSARMIDALRVEHVQISFALRSSHSEDGAVVTEKAPSHFEVRRTKFATLTVKVYNLTQEELRLLLRLQPSLHDQPHNVAMDLSKKIVWSGVLQRILGNPLKPGETVEAELGLVALARSVYEINATVEEVRSRRRELDGASGIGPNMERRIWHARNPCLITAVD